MHYIYAKPIAVIPIKDLEKLQLGKPAKVYGCADHMLYNPDYHVNLYAENKISNEFDRISAFYGVSDQEDLIREMAKHIEKLQNSVRNNIKPWEDTFPPTLLPKYIDEVFNRESYQTRIKNWMQTCFGEEIANDKIERNHRFLEEALELVQACGCGQDEAHKLVDYVYGREVGEKSQEVGGVMVTLAALCLAQDIDMQRAGDTEISRIEAPEIIERIRAKQKSKPQFSPIPGCYPERQLDRGNTGHGHVWARPDGMTARCGGPAICHQCALDQAQLTKDKS